MLTISHTGATVVCRCDGHLEGPLLKCSLASAGTRPGSQHVHRKAPVRKHHNRAHLHTIVADPHNEGTRNALLIHIRSIAFYVILASSHSTTTLEGT